MLGLENNIFQLSAHRLEENSFQQRIQYFQQQTLCFQSFTQYGDINKSILVTLHLVTFSYILV